MRHTHPNLFKTYLAFAVLSIALGLNFIFLTPTFMPLDVPKWPIGLVLIGCGVTKLTLLVLDFTWHPNRGLVARWEAARKVWLRRSMALTVAIYSFWAGALTFDFFRLSQTSLQLPLTYFGLAVLGFLLLLEPFSNPAAATEKLK